MQCRCLRLERRVGGKRRHPGETPRARCQPPDGVSHGQSIAAFQSVGEHDYQRAARSARETRYREKCTKACGDARSPVPIGDGARDFRKRAGEVLVAERAGQPGQPRAEGQRLDRRERLGEGVGETEIVFRVRLHRTRDIDEEKHATQLFPALRPDGGRGTGSTAHHPGQAAAKIEAIACVDGDMAISSAVRRPVGEDPLHRVQPPAGG